MLQNKVLVVSLTKNTLQTSTVTTKKPGNILHTANFNWTPATLAQTLNKIKTDFKVNSCRLLLSDDFSYTVNINIPVDKEIKNEREFVFQSISSQIPEKLNTKNWDYKIIKSDSKTKTALIFSPVLSVYDTVSQAFQKAELSIEAIEPVTIAKSRSENPVISLALKTELDGLDKKVLNIKPDRTKKNLLALIFITISVIIATALRVFATTK